LHLTTAIAKINIYLPENLKYHRDVKDLRGFRVLLAPFNDKIKTIVMLKSKII